MKVLNDPKAKKLDKKSKAFWILVKSLNDFRNNDNGGYLPVSINIPDLTMDTKSYVELKKIYKAQYESDVKAFKGYVIKNLESIGMKKDIIKDELITRFIKNCRSLKLVRGKSMADEVASPDLEELSELFIDPMAAFADPTENKGILFFVHLYK